MFGSLMYGLFLGLSFVVLYQVAPQPGGALVWWSLNAVQLIRGAQMTWRRTRLPFATGAMLAAAVASVLICWATILGHHFPWLPLRWAVPVYALAATGPLCFVIESRVHRRQWRAWGTFMEDKGFVDVLLGRHIPDLRNERH